MLRGLLVLIAFALGFLPGVARAEPVDTDRWLELDLYWFDAQQPQQSAVRFWDRYEPLYRNASGYRGVILNIGFTANYVMTYCSLDQPIAFPDTSGQELGAKVEGALAGDTAARQAGWRKRFEGHGNAEQRVAYGPWTYRGLGRLTSALRSEAKRRGMADFRVGSFISAFNNAYGSVAPFAESHPEAWTRWRPKPDLIDTSAYFDPVATLKADSGCFAGLPGGIEEGTPVHAAFAAQWGALSKAVGLDTIMLRDGMGFPRTYTRYGPWGLAVPDRATADRITGGMAALLRGIKQSAPGSLTMMYSTAATATSDWRANGLDLETIARGGDLDIFVDQTWAGAWGEVGVRQQTYWNAPILGWTYQLGYLLQHRAMLSGTKVRHYFITETFDAWESWNTIHTARERLKWAIWAWSHVGAKTPNGLQMTAGTYVAWGNSGHSLIPADDVAFLAATLDDAARDAAVTDDIRGPTLVYSREAFAKQMDVLQPDLDLRDRTDEQIGKVAKWGVPILSVTRADWVPEVTSDIFVFGATTGMAAATRNAIVAKAQDGQPMAFFGAFGTAIDPAFLGLAHALVTPYDPPLQDRMMRASRGPRSPDVRGVGKGFDAPPPQRANRGAYDDVVYSFAGSVGLLRREAQKIDVVLWDPPPLVDYWYRPIRDNMNGDPAPYVIAAATIADQLAGQDAPRPIAPDLARNMAISAWTVRGGGLRLLAGNLEEGLHDDADQSQQATIRLPQAWRGQSWTGWDGAVRNEADGVLTVKLASQASLLLRSK